MTTEYVGGDRLLMNVVGEAPIGTGVCEPDPSCTRVPPRYDQERRSDEVRIMADVGNAEELEESIFAVASGFMAAKYLFVAAEVGVFEHLARAEATLEELSRQITLPVSRVRLLVGALASLELLELRDGKYRNGPAAELFLAGNGGIDLRPALRFWNGMNYPLWMRLEEVLRSGRTSATMRLAGAQQRTYSAGVDACSALAAQTLPRRYDFGPHQRVLDLGGGSGVWLKELLRAHPHLSGVLMDFPNAASIARETLADELATGRVDIVEGDFFSDPIPTGCDVVLLANVMHAFGVERNIQLLKRVREHAEPNGTALLADLWTDSTGTTPRLAAMMAGSYFLTTGEGGVYPDAEVADWLALSGWNWVRQQPLSRSTLLVVARAINEQ